MRKSLYFCLLLWAAVAMCQQSTPQPQTGPTLPPVPWDPAPAPCIVVDGNFPYIHIVDCPTDGAASGPQNGAPISKSNPNPGSCQDCVGQ